MKTRFYLSIVFTFLIIVSCGIFSRKIEQVTEDTKKDVEKKILKEWGLDEDKRKDLIANGKKAKGEILKVEDTRETLNNNPKVKLYVKVKPEGEEEFDAVITTYVSRVTIPRKGDNVTVYYNPKDKKEIIVE
jgi:hypothetical protein